MLKYLLQKILGSFLHSKHKHYRHGNSRPMHQYGRRSSSDYRSGYGHNQQGYGYYKNRNGSSS